MVFQDFTSRFHSVEPSQSSVSMRWSYGFMIWCRIAIESQIPLLVFLRDCCKIAYLKNIVGTDAHIGPLTKDFPPKSGPMQTWPLHFLFAIAHIAIVNSLYSVPFLMVLIKSQVRTRDKPPFSSKNFPFRPMPDSTGLFPQITRAAALSGRRDKSRRPK